MTPTPGEQVTKNKPQMKIQELAKFVIAMVREKHGREVKRAEAIAAAAASPAAETTSAPAVPDIAEIADFLRGQPFGCHTDKARKFAQLVTGRKIPRKMVDNRYAERVDRLGRLRLGVVTGNSAGHHCQNGQVVLSLNRGGNFIRLAPTPETAQEEAQVTSTVLEPYGGNYIARSDVRPATADEAAAFLACVESSEANLFTLGQALLNIPTKELCEKNPRMPETAEVVSTPTRG
jgi:hypothetical protein